MTKLLLVRHGESEANLIKAFAGHYNAKLTDLGRLQAKAAAERIKKEYNITKVYASDLSRAFDTGKAIAEASGVPIVPNSSLREIMAGKWEGRLIDELLVEFEKDYGLWRTDIGNATCTDGEAVTDLLKRVIKALEDIAKAHSGEEIAIATHATPIRATQSFVEKGSLCEMKNVPWTLNASISVLEYEDGKWSFSLISSDDHLENIKSLIPANV